MSFNTNKEEFKIMTYNVLAHFATKHNKLLHLWTFKTPNLKSLGIYCFINYYSFINFI